MTLEGDIVGIWPNTALQTRTKQELLTRRDFRLYYMVHLAAWHITSVAWYTIHYIIIIQYAIQYILYITHYLLLTLFDINQLPTNDNYGLSFTKFGILILGIHRPWTTHSQKKFLIIKPPFILLSTCYTLLVNNMLHIHKYACYILRITC